MKKEKIRLATRDIAIIALFVAVIEVFKLAMTPLPNIELTSFLLIIFSLYFGKKIYFAIPVFILIEGAIYGFGLWWIMYLYAWPILVFVTRIFKHNTSTVFWATVSGVFGLLFGLMCAIPYLFMGGISTAVSWWIAGIPWDLVHGISSFFIMLLLFKPVTNVIKKLKI